MLQSDDVTKLRLRRFNPGKDRLKKARPTHRTARFFAEIEKRDKATGILAVKADGHSGVVSHTPGEDVILRYRTDSGAELLNLGPGTVIFSSYAQNLTFSLHVEITAMADGYMELGHYYVKSAIKNYKEGNKGRVRLRLKAFALESIHHHGHTYTPQASSLWFLPKLFFVNTLFEIVKHVTIEMEKKRVSGTSPLELVFKKDGSLIAIGYQAFQQWALKEADTRCIEGWVFKVEESIFDNEDSQHSRNDPTIVDSNDQIRDRSALKIKREPNGEFLAIKVENYTKRQRKGQSTVQSYEEETEYYLYGVSGKNRYGIDERVLRYAANVTDNKRIVDMLANKTAAFTIDDESDSNVFSPKFDDIRSAAIQVEVTSAGITPNFYLTGVKQYGLRKTLVNFNFLSDVQEISKTLPHFRSLQSGRQLVGAAGDDEDSCVKKFAYRPRKAARPDPPSAGLIRQKTPGGPNLQVEDDPIPPPKLPAQEEQADKVEPEAVVLEPEREPSPPPRAGTYATFEELEKAETQAWTERYAEITAPIEQKVFYYEFGEKVPYNVILPVITVNGNACMADDLQKGDYTYRMNYPVKAPDGTHSWKTLIVENPPKLLSKRTFRKPSASPKKFLVHRSCGLSPGEVDILHQKIWFFGGEVSFEPSSFVDIVIIGAKELAEYNSREKLLPHHVCQRMRESCKPEVYFLTHDDILPTLRPRYPKFS